jgi:hypothetical protein
VAYSTPGIRADGRNKFIVSFENWRGDDATPSPGAAEHLLLPPGAALRVRGPLLPHGRGHALYGEAGELRGALCRPANITPELGRWYCYELMVKANTAGKRDGRIACWLDGKLIADFPGLRLRDVDSLKINSASLSLHIRSNVVRENKKWYDDAVIATSYIGPVVNPYEVCGQPLPGVLSDWILKTW